MQQTPVEALDYATQQVNQLHCAVEALGTHILQFEKRIQNTRLKVEANNANRRSLLERLKTAMSDDTARAYISRDIALDPRSPEDAS